VVPKPDEAVRIMQRSSRCGFVLPEVTRCDDKDNVPPGPENLLYPSQQSRKGYAKGLTGVNFTLTCIHFYKCLPEEYITYPTSLSNYETMATISSTTNETQARMPQRTPLNKLETLLPAASVAYFDHFLNLWGWRTTARGSPCVHPTGPLRALSSNSSFSAAHPGV
jgi:hypothetical protein